MNRKEKKIRHIVSLWESCDKRVVKMYNDRQLTCSLNVFLSDLIELGLKVRGELYRRRDEALAAAGERITPTDTSAKAQIISFKPNPATGNTPNTTGDPKLYFIWDHLPARELPEETKEILRELHNEGRLPLWFMA